MHFFAGRRSKAFDGDWICRFRAAEETVFGNCGPTQTGDRGNFRQQIELEAGNCRAFVTSGGGIYAEENQVFEIVAKFYVAQSGKATDKKPRGNEENYGDGNLSHY